MKNIFLTGSLIFLWLILIACKEQNLVQTSTATPAASPMTPIPTPPSSTLIPTSEPTATYPASAIQSSATPLEPLITATQIIFLGWSPESRLLAYLDHTPEALAVSGPFPPGSLKFLNVTTGQVCDS